MTLPQEKFRSPVEPGLYGYCGSANGPGGLTARIARHLSASKKMHWHVDHLTMGGEIVDVAGVVEGCECDLMQELSSVEGATIPVDGFGSSDCKTCRSHLVRLPLNFSFRDVGLDSLKAETEEALAQ